MERNSVPDWPACSVIEVSAGAPDDAFFGAGAVTSGAFVLGAVAAGVGAAAAGGVTPAFPVVLPAAWTVPGEIMSTAMTHPNPRSLNLITDLLYPALLSR
jgi:hypothetical protein